MTSWRIGAFLVVLTGCVACASARSGGAVRQDEASLSLARPRLQKLRSAWSPRSGTIPVTVVFRKSVGVTLHGRGAIALRPPDALRMILVGPGGLTAMDLWIRNEQWRLSFPMRQRVVRGNESAPVHEHHDLPVALLRWWLLHPFEGRLVSVMEHDGRLLFVLDSLEGTFEVTELDGDAVQVVRRADTSTERIRATRPGCGRATYSNLDTGLDVDVICESPSAVEVRRPDDGAFEDPDALMGDGAAR